MNFQVPQFIETKPRIIGRLTLGQFGYVAVAGIIAYISFQLFNFFFFLLIVMIVGPLSIALAFFKFNGQPLPLLILSGLTFFWKPRVYVWQRTLPETSLDTSAIEKIEYARKLMGLQEKLKSLALNVITGKAGSGGLSQEGGRRDQYQVVQFMTGERRLAKRIDYQ